MKYPLAHVTYGPAEIAAVVETLCAGETTCGQRVAAFEQQFAGSVGARHGVMVNSGSSADLLLAYGLGQSPCQDEILIPAVTWPTQVWACIMAGYTVRLVDVDAGTFQMDLDDLSTKIGPLTRAIFVTHLLGNVGDMDRLSGLAADHHVAVLEDCCEALGARWAGHHVGAWGDAAYSFFFSHHLTTMEGGMVATNTLARARAYRLLRSHGWEPRPGQRFHFPSWGFNVRPMEVQGAFGLAQLPKLPAGLAARASNAERLAGWTYRYFPEFLQGMAILGQATPSWHGFPLLVRPGAPFSRRQFTEYLEDHGIETRPIVAGNLARQPAARQFEGRLLAGPLPGADLLHDQGLYLGVAPFDDPEGCTYVAEVISDFLRPYRLHRSGGGSHSDLQPEASVSEQRAPA